MHVAGGHSFILTALLLISGAAQGAAPTSKEAQQRSADRTNRVAVAKGFEEARKKALRGYCDALNGLTGWLITNLAKAEAEKTLAEIESVDPLFAPLSDLRKKLSAIDAPKELTADQQKELATRRATATRARSTGLLQLAQTCYGAKLMGYAYDIVGELLERDPDNAIARTALGHIKTPDGWKTLFAATQIRSGNVYVPEFGWIPTAAVERVQKGEWFEKGMWMPLATAEKVHADLANPWIVETENFTLRSTASRRRTILIAERLEGIRSFCFRQYLEFFLRGSGAKGAQLLFNQSAEKKMVVNFFGTKADYDAYIAKDARGSGQELLLRSAGFYSPSKRASFFYYHNGPFLFNLMQHEITHQILGEYARGNGDPNPWLTEGVAETLEYAIREESGKIWLPKGGDHPDVAFAARMLKQGTLMSVAEILRLDHTTFHKEPGRSDNYRISGAFCRFMLEVKNGACAEDFLEFLYDSYRTGKANLPEYSGMDMGELDKEFQAYLYAAMK